MTHNKSKISKFNILYDEHMSASDKTNSISMSNQIQKSARDNEDAMSD